MSTVRANDRCESYATGSDRAPIRVRRISSYALRARGDGPIGPQRGMPGLSPCPRRLQPGELFTADRDPTTGNKNGSWLKRRMLEAVLRATSRSTGRGCSIRRVSDSFHSPFLCARPLDFSLSLFCMNEP